MWRGKLTAGRLTLLVDIGNSRIKWATDRNGSLIRKGAIEHSQTEVEKALEEQWGRLNLPQRIISSNVAGERVATGVSQYCLAKWAMTPRFVTVTPAACGVQNGYASPQQLGVDRWMALIAAWDRFRSATCVVDCGTALTIDALSHDGHHLGGLIAPGLGLMQKALCFGTHALKDSRSGRQRLLADNTQDAIAAGSFFALTALIDSFVDKIQGKLSAPAHIILTGGDAPVLLPSLSTRAVLDTELVLRGLAVVARAGS
ncbi:MAG: type III pantothenate kinase [Gammaproteobacteria bacterium]